MQNTSALALIILIRGRVSCLTRCLTNAHYVSKLVSDQLDLDGSLVQTRLL